MSCTQSYSTHVKHHADQAQYDHASIIACAAFKRECHYTREVIKHKSALRHHVIESSLTHHTCASSLLMSCMSLRGGKVRRALAGDWMPSLGMAPQRVARGRDAPRLLPSAAARRATYSTARKRLVTHSGCGSAASATLASAPTFGKRRQVRHPAQSGCVVSASPGRGGGVGAPAATPIQAQPGVPQMSHVRSAVTPGGGIEGGTAAEAAGCQRRGRGGAEASSVPAASSDRGAEGMVETGVAIRKLCDKPPGLPG